MTLKGQRVQLEPLTDKHTEDLLSVGRDPQIWAYMPRPHFEDVEDVQSWIEDARLEFESGQTISFATIDLEGGKAVGSTRIYDFQIKDRGLEIGWTWLGLQAQRTVINTECKLLLMTYAFEELDAHRVQLKTDFRNLQSQTAIERLGAKKEGILRKTRICWDGHVRDTVYYSVIREEWASIKKRLQSFTDKS